MEVIQEDHTIYPEPRAQPEFLSENSGKLKRMKEMLSRSTCLYCLNPCKGESHKGCHTFNIYIINHLFSYFEQTNPCSLRLSPLYLLDFLRLNLNLDEQALTRIRPHIIEIFERFFEDFNDYFSTIFKKE